MNRYPWPVYAAAAQIVYAEFGPTPDLAAESALAIAAELTRRRQLKAIVVPDGSMLRILVEGPGPVKLGPIECGGLVIVEAFGQTLSMQGLSLSGGTTIGRPAPCTVTP